MPLCISELTLARGAQLSDYDRDTSRIAYPLGNRPPASMVRRVTAITFPTTLSSSSVNQIRVYDLDDDALTVSLSSQSNNNGTVTHSGDTVSYTPRGFFADVQVPDVDNNSLTEPFYRYPIGSIPVSSKSG